MYSLGNFSIKVIVEDTVTGIHHEKVVMENTKKCLEKFFSCPGILWTSLKIFPNMFDDFLTHIVVIINQLRSSHFSLSFAFVRLTTHIPGLELITIPFCYFFHSQNTIGRVEEIIKKNETSTYKTISTLTY